MKDNVGSSKRDSSVTLLKGWGGEACEEVEPLYGDDTAVVV